VAALRLVEDDDPGDRATPLSGTQLVTDSQPTAEDHPAGGKTAPSSPSSDPVPAASPLTGRNTETATVRLGSTSDLFDATPLIIGLSHAFTSFASLTLSTDFATCSPLLDVGESAAVLAGPDSGIYEASVWIKVTVLKIDEEAITIRAERTLSVDPIAAETCR